GCRAGSGVDFPAEVGIARDDVGARQLGLGLVVLGRVLGDHHGPEVLDRGVGGLHAGELALAHFAEVCDAHDHRDVGIREPFVLRHCRTAGNDDQRWQHSEFHLPSLRVIFFAWLAPILSSSAHCGGPPLALRATYRTSGETWGCATAVIRCSRLPASGALRSTSRLRSGKRTGNSRHAIAVRRAETSSTSSSPPCSIFATMSFCT